MDLRNTSRISPRNALLIPQKQKHAARNSQNPLCLVVMGLKKKKIHSLGQKFTFFEPLLEGSGDYLRPFAEPGGRSSGWERLSSGMVLNGAAQWELQKNQMKVCSWFRDRSDWEQLPNMKFNNETVSKLCKKNVKIMRLEKLEVA